MTRYKDKNSVIGLKDKFSNVIQVVPKSDSNYETTTGLVMLRQPAYQLVKYLQRCLKKTKGDPKASVCVPLRHRFEIDAISFVSEPELLQPEEGSRFCQILEQKDLDEEELKQLIVRDLGLNIKHNSLDNNKPTTKEYKMKFNPCESVQDPKKLTIERRKDRVRRVCTELAKNMKLEIPNNVIKEAVRVINEGINVEGDFAPIGGSSVPKNKFTFEEAKELLQDYYIKYHEYEIPKKVVGSLWVTENREILGDD